MPRRIHGGNCLKKPKLRNECLQLLSRSIAYRNHRKPQDIFAASDLTLSDEVMKAIDTVTKDILYPMG